MSDRIILGEKNVKGSTKKYKGGNSRSLLSVIVVNYNQEHYISEVLDSIFQQSTQPLEVIFVDDCSTDKSYQIVKKYQDQYTILRLVQLTQNSGSPILPIQIGIQEAKGDYLALIACDDFYLPGFFERAMSLLATHPEVGFLSGNICFFKDKKPYEFTEVELFSTKVIQFFTPDQLANIYSNFRGSILSPATIYKKELVVKYGGYQADLGSLSDYYLNCQIAFRCNTIYVPEKFAANRFIPSSYSNSIRFDLKKKKKIATALLKVLRREDEEFKEMIKKSGALGGAGIYTVFFLLRYTIYWKYFFRALKKRIFTKPCRAKVKETDIATFFRH